MAASIVKDMAGLTFGRLTVQSIDHIKDGQGAMWRCACSCGESTVVLGAHLRSSRVLSCGCYRKDNTRNRKTTHGAARVGQKTRAYMVWESMRSRCETPTAKEFKDYGGRGVKVCKRWSLFENFIADMGEPAPGMTLERKKNSGNYEPGNCTWETRLVQANNTRANVIVTVGVDRMTLAQFVRANGLQYSATRMQLKRGQRVIAGQQIEVTYPTRKT